MDDVLSAEQVEAIGRDADDWLADEETLARLMRSHEALRAAYAQARAALVMLVDWVDLSVGAFEQKYGTDDNDAAWAKARAALGGEG